MDLRTEITWLTVLSTITFVVGIALILLFSGLLTVVGIVLLTASSLVLIVDVTDVVGHWRQVAQE